VGPLDPRQACDVLGTKSRWWELVDELLINKHIATIEALENIVANRCRALAEQRTIIKSRTSFHWWPKIALPK
jgi:hypothetical protein